MNTAVLRAVLAAVACVVFTATAPAQEKITIAELDWDGGKAIAHFLEAVIEGPLASEAQIIRGLADQGIIGLGMSEGGGAIDVHPDLWMPNNQDFWDKYIDGNQTVATSLPYPASEGMYVPKYMAKTVQSIEDLASPKISALFDTDGNGKGEYWAGDSDWGAAKISLIKFKSYGLSELWEPSVVNYEKFKTQLKTAYPQRKPLLFYNWTPESVHSAYRLVLLKEPEPFEGCRELKLTRADWLDASTQKCKTADSTVYVAYSKSLQQRNPRVARFLSNLRLDPALISEWILKIDREKQDPSDVVRAWIKANHDTVEEWIK